MYNDADRRPNNLRKTGGLFFFQIISAQIRLIDIYNNTNKIAHTLRAKNGKKYSNYSIIFEKKMI